jgi:hypothetical protein
MTRSPFLIRLIAGLIITGAVGYRLLTATLPGEPQQVVLLPAYSSADYLDLVPVGLREAVPNDPHDARLLTEAFSTQASELLAYGDLDLSSREDETLANVILAAEGVDLASLRPNEVFSFNRVVGLRTVERGYRPGLMYSNGEPVTGIGGGICIVSTLLYNAVLESGLKIIERHPHSGPVSYAEPGRDSAVSFGWADLCFKNTTDSPIHIRAGVKDDKLVVALYGKKKPGRTVEIVSEGYEVLPYKTIEKEDASVPEGEFIVEQAPRPGFAVTTVRLIRQNGRLVQREILSHDTVLPRDQIVLVSPKDGESSDGAPRLLGPPDRWVVPFEVPKSGAFDQPLALPASPAADQTGASLPR